MDLNSSSNAHRRIAALLLICLSVLISVELAARLLVPRISQIESRTVNEQREALNIKQPSNTSPTILLLGNSLLRTAIDVPLLQERLETKWIVRRFVVESTNYIDWYYGIRNLLDSGSRPRVIAIMLNTQQFLSDDIRGTYSAYHLFSTLDTIRAGIRTKMHLTEVTGLLVGHASGYYGLREEMRKFAFQSIVPQADKLTSLLLPPARTDGLTLSLVETKGVARLAELQQLCSDFVVRCIFMVASEIRPSKTRARLVSLSEETGLASAHIDLDQDLSEHHFAEDHFHYSQSGSIVYTENLARALKDIL